MSNFNVSSLLGATRNTRRSRGPRHAAETTASNEKMVLFVCTGNIARSASAKYLARQLSSHKSDWHFDSAGTGAVVGAPVARYIDDELASRNVDFSDHVAQQVNDQLVADSELILVMEKEHLDWMVHEWPQHRSKIHLLKQMARLRKSAGRRADPISYMKQVDTAPLAEDGIADPYGKGRESSREAVLEIEEALFEVIPWLGS